MANFFTLIEKIQTITAKFCHEQAQQVDQNAAGKVTFMRQYYDVYQVRASVGACVKND